MRKLVMVDRLKGKFHSRNGVLRYCRCGVQVLQEDREESICVFPSRFPLSPPSLSITRFTWFFPPLLFLLFLFLLFFVRSGDHERTTTCQIIRVESEKFKKYSKFNYPGEPRSFEIVRAANGWLKNSRSTNRATNF